MRFVLTLLHASLAELRAWLRPRKSRGGSAKRRVGDAAEAFALEFLTRQGFTLLEQGLHDAAGELDLVGTQRGLDGYVVVEVRSRREGGLVSPREAVDPAKQKQVRATARRLLAVRGLRGPVRFDIAAVWLDAQGAPTRCERYEGAF